MPIFFRKRLIIILLISLLAALPLAGCGSSQAAVPLADDRFLLDTMCTVTVYSAADKEAQSEALELCAAYDALFSRTTEGSDIWRINHANGQKQSVDPATAELISTGLEYCALSGGGFDISIGRLSALWNFGSSSTVPEEAALAAARSTVDYTKVYVSGHSVQMKNPEAWLDLGGIAKGYIADQMAALLQERGVKSAIIDLGGNVVTVGAKPDGSPWSVGVRLPFSGRQELAGVLNMSGANGSQISVVTSGIYERCFTADGVLYHHTLNPATGWPVESDVAGATMITTSSTQGDALSTIFLMAGSEKAPELLKKYPGLRGVVLVLKSGEILSYGDIDFTPATN